MMFSDKPLHNTIVFSVEEVVLVNRWQTVRHRIVVSLSILVTLYGSLIDPMLEGLIALLIPFLNNCVASFGETYKKLQVLMSS